MKNDTLISKITSQSKSAQGEISGNIREQIRMTNTVKQLESLIACLPEFSNKLS